MEPQVNTRPTPTTLTALDLVDCPECGAPAEVEWRDVVESTDRPVELAKIHCLHQHCFLMPLENLDHAG